MACQVSDVAGIMEAWAPPAACEPGDNVGLLTGIAVRPVSHVLIALDIDEAVIAHAKSIGAEMIVSHHPHIYKPLAAISSGTRAGMLTIQAVEAGIALFAAHTNLDRAKGGVNDALCEAVGLAGTEPAAPGEIARAARLREDMPLDGFAMCVKRALGAPSVRVTGDGFKPVRALCVVSGAGRHDIGLAVASGADCLLTGEIGYHDGLEALSLGLAVVEAGHYHTERPVLAWIEKHLQSHFQRLQYTVRTTVYETSTSPFHTVG